MIVNEEGCSKKSMDVDKESGGSKRPRVEDCIDLTDTKVDLEELREQLKLLVEENTKLEDRNKVLEAAFKEHESREAQEEVDDDSEVEEEEVGDDSEVEIEEDSASDEESSNWDSPGISFFEEDSDSDVSEEGHSALEKENQELKEKNLELLKKHEAAMSKVDEENRRMKYEIKLMQEEKKQMQEENKDVKEEYKQITDENKQMKDVVEELREMIECPVCLLVPRQRGPVPVCSNGHILCHACTDRIRLDARAAGENAKCPSCTFDLGNTTSLLASRLVERVEHECEHNGCEQMIAFDQLVNHQMSCSFRKVLCPGSGKTCKNVEMPLNKVEEHIKTCPDNLKPIQLNNAVVKLRMSERYKDSEETLLWGSHTFMVHGKTFFMRKKREKHILHCETVMLGGAEECKGFFVDTKILDKDSKTVTANTSHPRPIGQEAWGHMGLLLPEKGLSGIWRTDRDEHLAFGIQICIWLAQDGIVDRAPFI